MGVEACFISCDNNRGIALSNFEVINSSKIFRPTLSSGRIVGKRRICMDNMRKSAVRNVCKQKNCFCYLAVQFPVLSLCTCCPQRLFLINHKNLILILMTPVFLRRKKLEKKIYMYSRDSGICSIWYMWDFKCSKYDRLVQLTESLQSTQSHSNANSQERHCHWVWLDGCHFHRSSGDSLQTSGIGHDDRWVAARDAHCRSDVSHKLAHGWHEAIPAEEKANN